MNSVRLFILYSIIVKYLYELKDLFFYGCTRESQFANGKIEVNFLQTKLKSGDLFCFLFNFIFYFLFFKIVKCINVNWDNLRVFTVIYDTVIYQNVEIMWIISKSNSNVLGI